MRRVVLSVGLVIGLVEVGGCAKPAPRAPVTWYAQPYGYTPPPAVYILPVLVQQPPAPTYSAPPAPPAPSFAHVAFVGVLVGPGKIDGTQWDGPGGTVSREDWQQVATALGAADPYVAVIGVFAGPTIQALEKPDCGGSAGLTSSAGAGTTWELMKKQDTFTPQWRSAWDHVPLDGSARIHVEMIDRDLFLDDPMGGFEVNATWIQTALTAGRVVAVPVADQTNKQILFALVAARPE